MILDIKPKWSLGKNMSKQILIDFDEYENELRKKFESGYRAGVVDIGNGLIWENTKIEYDELKNLHVPDTVINRLAEIRTKLVRLK